MRSYFIEADVFFSHWRRMLGGVKKRSGIDIYGEMEKKYKGDVIYSLLRIIRNYIMHAGDVIHGAHTGLNGDVELWCDVETFKNDIRDKDIKKVLVLSIKSSHTWLERKKMIDCMEKDRKALISRIRKVCELPG